MKISKRIIIASIIVISGLTIIGSLTYLAFIIFEPENPGLPKESIGNEIIIFVLVFSIGVLFGQLGNFYYFPEIRPKNRSVEMITNTAKPLEVVRYISNEEERSVISAIIALNERTYQFEISRETGLSRMKVHRILKRLEERGIVKRDNEGRGSRVFLVDWLQ